MTEQQYQRELWRIIVAQRFGWAYYVAAFSCLGGFVAAIANQRTFLVVVLPIAAALFLIAGDWHRDRLWRRFVELRSTRGAG
jgi:hypothetical protein